MSQDEAKNLFMAIQNKIGEDSQQLSVVRAQLQQSQREIRIVDLVSKELSNLQPETPTYKSIGKMFLFTPQSELKKELSAKAATNKDTQAALNKKASFLERNIQDANNSLRDLLHN
ncbi:hypothetical protein DSO57_1024810 [Entomophthora muscae]|uniref:Uncharacterized protein n=1 Tax=Entomophthora muscae TaxID=34485 RepID=A0ACC2SS26_9FUNG|nr:hypothetical protein DSO57_1024810 [Entomophthora muscae]